MKFVIIVMVVIVYVFHEVISNNYYDGHGQTYAEEDPYTSDEQSNYNNLNGNNYCPYNCEKADSVEYSQSQAVPLGYYHNKAKSDHALAASHNTKSEGGYVFVKFLGGVFVMAQPHTCAVYYLFNDDIDNSFYTASSSVRTAATSEGGYVTQGIAFYCYCDPYFYTIPLFQFFCSTKNDTQLTTDFDSVTGSDCEFDDTVCWILPPLSDGGHGSNQGGYSSGGGYHGGGSSGGGYSSGGGGYSSGGGGYSSGGGGYQSGGKGYFSNKRFQTGHKQATTETVTL